MFKPIKIHSLAKDKSTFVYTLINSHTHVSAKGPLVQVMRFSKTNHFHNNIYTKMLNVILNFFGYYM